MSLSEVAKMGNRLQTLIATRDFLANRLDGYVEDKSVAPIVKELREVIAEIDQIPQPRKGTVADGIHERRAARFAESKIRTGP